MFALKQLLTLVCLTGIIKHPAMDLQWLIQRAIRIIQNRMARAWLIWKKQHVSVVLAG